MSDLSPSTHAKRKQILLAVAILVGILLLSAIGVYFTQDPAPPAGTTRNSDIKTKSYIAPGEKIDPQDAWRGVADTRLNTLENKLSSLETENRDLKRKLGEKGDKSTANKSSAPEQMNDDEIDRRMKEYEKSIGHPTAYPNGTPSNPQAIDNLAKPAVGAAVNTHNVPGKLQTQQAAPPSGTTASGPSHPHAPPSFGIMTVKLHHPVGTPIKKASGTPTDPKTLPKTTQNYLPSGMFGQAVVLSGLDAPTGGQAQSNPHPVLLQLRDLAVLPNHYRYDWKECLISGAGYGDISSERAYIRTESLSCVAKDGKVLDVPIKGYIAGEDGKAGMRGRLVSKQGQALANALLAGVVSGIGVGLQQSSTTQSVSPLGTTTSVNPGAEYRAGIGAGVGRGLDRLSNYYIQLAEKMFPVIEVDAARVVDVILTKGVLVDVDVQQQ